MTGAPPAPHAVLLDVGDTMLEERRYDLEAGIGAVVSDRAAVAMLARDFRAESAEWHREEREPLLAAWLQQRVPALASTATDAVEDAIWGEVVTLVPRAGVGAALRRLASDGVPAAAVSNAAFSGRVLRAELARHGLASLLRFVLSSADVGARKPNEAIFAAAVAELGARADRTWFVGDRLEEDVAGARRAGLPAVWFGSGAVADRAPDGIAIVGDWDAFVATYERARRAEHTR